MSLIETLENTPHALTVAELASVLHLGRTALYDLTRRHGIPHLRIAGSIRFDPNEIADWLRNRRIR